MLELFRSSLGGWISKTFIGLLVASFALWGIADYTSSSSSNTVIQVGETKVDAQQFRFALDRQILLQSQQFGRPLTLEEARSFGIEQQVLSQTASDAAWDEKARLLGLGLSDDMLGKTIAADPAFQDSSGRFNRRIFSNTLQNAGLRDEDYITLQKQAMVRQQVLTGTLVNMGLNKTFFDILSEHQQQRRDVKFITIGEAQVDEPAAPTSDELNEYFELNKANYSAPEYRTIAYLKADARSLAKVDEVSEDVVREEYDANIASFTQAAERQIEQIVLADDEAKQKAKAALDNGADFDALVVELGLNAAELNLGTFKKEDFPDTALAEKAFAAISGSTSGIEKGAFGSIIFRATEVKAEIVQPYESVKERLREEIAYGDAQDAIFDSREAIEDARASGKTLQEIAQEQGLTLQIVTVDKYGVDEQDELLGDILSAGNLLEQAFETEIAVETDPLSLNAENPADDGYVWFEVRDIKDARDRELSEVQQKVSEAWRGEKLAEAVDAKAQELLAKAQSGESIDALGAELGVEVTQLSSISRNDSDAGLSRAALITAFEGANGHWDTAAGTGENETLLLFASDATADKSELDEAITDRISRSFIDDVYVQLTANLQSELKPNVNPAALERALSASR